MTHKNIEKNGPLHDVFDNEINIEKRDDSLGFLRNTDNETSRKTISTRKWKLRKREGQREENETQSIVVAQGFDALHASRALGRLNAQILTAIATNAGIRKD